MIVIIVVMAEIMTRRLAPAHGAHDGFGLQGRVIDLKAFFQ